MLYQYTAIDEYTRLRYLGAYEEQSTYSSADFLRKAVRYFRRNNIPVECVQTDNSFEFANRFSTSRREIETLFERTAREMGISHKKIRPYTPRHNGKVDPTAFPCVLSISFLLVSSFALSPSNMFDNPTESVISAKTH